jgi:hypothetical protein
MSSGTYFDWTAVGKIFGATMGGGAIPDQSDVMGRIRRLGMSPRQQSLNHLYAIYRAEQYESCRVEWDGSQRVGLIESEAVATGAYIPPGFYDMGAMLPIRFRKPAAPYPLARVIVDRFTALLYSEKRHPKVKVLDDDQTDDWVQAMISDTRFWAMCLQARTLAGAMGSVCVGFSIINGKIHLEVFDPRWTTPTFRSRTSNELERVEILYQYPREMVDPATGVWTDVPYWYRRVIDAERDVVFRSIPVTDEVPVWEVKHEVFHGLGEIPCVWVQNTPTQDDVDGDSDFHGALDMLHAIDQLLSQAQIGTIANADPTLVISTDAQLPPELSKGSRAPIQLPSSGKAQYLELQGVGSKAATELANLYRARVLEVCHCVLEDGSKDGGGKKTATEIERTYAAMLGRADVLREQQSERLIKPLIGKILRATRRLETGSVDEATGQLVRGIVVIPPKIERGEDGRIVRKVQHDVGTGEVLVVHWPSFYEPTLEDADIATKTAVQALAGKLVDEDTAVAYVAPFFRVADPRAMAERIRAADAQKAALVDGIEAGLPAGETIEGSDPFAPEPDVDVSGQGDEPLAAAQITAVRELVQNVIAGKLPRESGLAILTTAFPSISRQRAEALLGGEEDLLEAEEVDEGLS